MIEPPWPLPLEWRWEPFGEVVRVAADLVDPVLYPDRPHVAPNHIESHTGRLLPVRTVAEDGVTSAKHRFSAGQVLYSKIRPYLAKVAIPEYDGLCSADMYPLNTELVPRFLKWWLLTPTFTRLAAGDQARTVLPKINKDSLYRLPVPVPPIDEQHRVVATLEDHLSRLHAADNYLVGASARGLSMLRTREHALLKTGVQMTAITDLLLLSIGGVWGSSPGVDERDVDVLRVTELRPRGRLDQTTAARRSVSAKQLASRQLRPGDLLLEKSGGGPRTPVGRVGLVEVAPPGTIFANFMQLLRPDPERVRPRYLHLALNALHGAGGTAHLQAASTNIRNIKASDYLHLEVVEPPLLLQDELIAELDEAERTASRLKIQTLTAQSRSANLRRGLLTAAFAGRV